MQLILSEENLHHLWGSATEYWFSRTDYTIHKYSDLPSEDHTVLVEHGFIPFLTISNEEVIRAYMKSLDNPKLSDKLDGLSSEECVEVFWKYFNAYDDVSSGFSEFEKKFVEKKFTEWCRENAVEYKVI